MKTWIVTMFGFVLSLAVAGAAPLTAGQQATLDAQKKIIAKWAAKRVVVKAVKSQNERGPIAGMDNRAWQALRPGDPLVMVFEKNSAGVWLTKKLKAGNGLYAEAFVSGAKGEKAAFVTKPTSYSHAEAPKFTVPMSGKPWQGEPGIDESTKVDSIQISTPVFDDGKPIGVLVVGFAMSKLGVK